MLLFVPLRRFRFDDTVGLVVAFRLICLCVAVDQVWLLGVVVFYLSTRLTLAYSCVGLRVGNYVRVSYAMAI